MPKDIKIKFCGFTNLEDTQAAVDLGVDYLGFIIEVPQSKRNVSIEKFLEICRNIKKKNETKIVAVLVNMKKEKIDLLVNSGFVDIIQFHGDEDKKLCKEYKKKRIEIWKVFNINENLEIDKQVEEILEFIDSTDKILLDATTIKEKEQGQVNRFLADSIGFQVWQKLKEKNFKLVLAGGINARNIYFYLKEFQPKTVDLITGVEDSPGKKSLTKMLEFMRIIKR